MLLGATLKPGDNTSGTGGTSARIVDARITEIRQSPFPGGVDTTIEYQLFFDDGTSKLFRGHGWSIKDTTGLVHVSYFLGSGSDYLYSSYVAQQSKEGRNVEVQGQTLSNLHPPKYFRGTLRDLEQIDQSPAEFLLSELVGREF